MREVLDECAHRYRQPWFHHDVRRQVGSPVWAGTETASHVKDVFFLVCDGLKGLPEVVGNVWPLTTVQTCIIHLART